MGDGSREILLIAGAILLAGLLYLAIVGDPDFCDRTCAREWEPSKCLQQCRAGGA
jgi:hypothetical protein